MTKNDFLFQLNKNLKVLDSSTRDDLLEYYEGIIDEELSEGRSLYDIFNKLGNPKDLARKIISNINNGENSTDDFSEILQEEPPVYKTTKFKVEEPVYQTKNKTVQNNTRYKESENVVHTKEKKKGRLSMFWIIFLCFGFVTIPVTLALSIVGLALILVACVVTLAFIISSFVIGIAGLAVVVYGIVMGVMGKSLMVAFAFSGAGLLVFALGTYLSYLTVKLFKKIIKKRKKGDK